MFTKRQHLPALLAAAAAVLLATAGTAAAATVNPLPVNAANWSGFAGYGSTTPGWYKDSFGIIHLQGAAKQTSLVPPLQRVLGTLPAAARPARDVFTIAHTFNGTYADLEIETNGTVYVIGATAPAVEGLSFVSLEGITYQPANTLPATPVAVNGANWSPNTSYGSNVRAPAAFTDGSGIVHLEGAAKQTNPSGSGATVLGSVPSGDQPGYNVYTIVATNDGTYADLVITASGQIELIGPRSPALKDLSFVSLEGISYARSFALPGSMFMNTANWSDLAGYESRSPGWYTDNAGVIHLEGAATQTSSAGPNAGLVATLPVVARPNRTVYTIVHTFSGTYADLAITPSGQILVIGPRSPAVEDLRFLSLEGITYQQ